jgi:hypothetical protein
MAVAMSVIGASCSAEVQAAERGLTHYLPGYYGDFAVAVAPTSGLYVYSTFYHYEAVSEGPKLLDGASINATASINGFLYATGYSILGGQYAFGGYTAYAGADLRASIATPVGTLSISDETSGLSDTSLSPLSLYWSSGNLHWNLYTAVMLPTGAFNSAASLNLGRNYYSSDTVLAVTWLDPKLGLEISVVPGLMANTRNGETGYKTGTELHIDGMLNAYFSPTFAIGLHGYIYDQISADTGPGSDGLDVKSFSLGIGPSLLWVPAEIGIKGKVVAKWLHEFDAENRFEGDIISLTGMLQF